MSEAVPAPAAPPVQPATTRRRRRPNLFDLILGALVYSIFAALLVPLALVVLFSFNDSTSLSWPFQGFSLRWYEYISTQPRIYEVAVNSLELAIAVAVISTLLGTLGGLALARYRFPGKDWLANLRILPIVMPWLLIALGLVTLFVSISMRLSLWTVTIGHITVTLPFTMLIVQSQVAGFDVRLEDASRDLGAGWWWTFRRVVLPLISPGIRAAFFFSIIISLNEVIIAFFLAGYSTTLPVYMYGQFLHVITPEVNAISGVMVVLAALLLALESLVTRALTDLQRRISG